MVAEGVGEPVSQLPPAVVGEPVSQLPLAGVSPHHTPNNLGGYLRSPWTRMRMLPGQFLSDDFEIFLMIFLIDF